MKKLNERLQRIADRLQDCETMADVGTDHGFLPVYLIESGRCSRAVATDISAPSLAKAARLGTERGIGEDRLVLRTGDGLCVLAPGEVDGVVLAGMGGTLMIQILEEDPAKSRTYHKFVLQPRSDAGPLRRWLLEHGYRIAAEDLVTEGKFLPQILTVIPPDQPMNGYEDLGAEGCPEDGDLYYEAPPWILRAEGPAGDFLNRILARQRRILEGLERAKETDTGRLRQVQDEIEYLQQLLKKLEEENG